MLSIAKTQSRWLRASLAAVFMSAVAAASAQSTAPLSADLQEIAQAGEIVIGVREDALPFAFVDQDGMPKGYSVDICNRIAQNLRTALKRPDLRVRYNTVTINTRALLVREKVVDLECGATSHTRARTGEFDFSVAYGVEQAQLISLKAKPVPALSQLGGQKVLVAGGSTSASWLRAQSGVAGEVVPVRNAGRAYFDLTEGRTAAYVGSGEVFLGEVLRRGGKATDFNRVTLAGTDIEPLAVMMRKGRPGLKQVADDTIRSLSKSGELVTLYGKWFESPISARRVSLAQPMSSSWLAMVSAPNDQPAN
jgi:glutamate/aspartate transport system substrate-binding protein